MSQNTNFTQYLAQTFIRTQSHENARNSMKISSHKEKQKYKQTHILVDISL